MGRDLDNLTGGYQALLVADDDNALPLVHKVDLLSGVTVARHGTVRSQMPPGVTERRLNTFGQYWQGQDSSLMSWLGFASSKA